MSAIAEPNSHKAALDAFRASGQDRALEDISEDIRECLPHAADAVRVYEGGHWIARMGERVTGDDAHNWYLLIETEEHDTFRSGQNLSDLEAILFEWAREEDL